MSRWESLPQFSKDMYTEKYLKNGESWDEWANKLAKKYSDDKDQAGRIFSYLEKGWFHPSTPISSDRGYPISCFTNDIEDNKKSIFDTWHENNWLGAGGGGIGTDWSMVSEIGRKLSSGGKSSGTIPMIKVSDASSLAVSQGGLRKASQACYSVDSHPEILDFINIRRPQGDPNRKSENIHHGIKITDEFIEAVLSNDLWDLKSPHDYRVVKSLPAWELLKKIIISRMETGEPYLMFIDNVLRRLPKEYKDNNMTVKVSNLCTEIFLHTDRYNTGVCCLVSLNLKHYDEFKDNLQFFMDVHTFTDNVLTRFIKMAFNKEGYEKAVNSAVNERSIGIGFMGYHDLLQSKMLPYGCLSANYLTKQIIDNVSKIFSLTNLELGAEKGTAPISKTKRNVNVMAIAPTASISILNGLASQGIDPRIANIYTAKTSIGSYTIRNEYLEKELDKIGMNTEKVWKSILENTGSVQHLDIPQDLKDVFKTAFEIDQRDLVTAVAIMGEKVCQGISTNLFFPADSDYEYVLRTHLLAWKLGLKSLYYVRSNALARATISNLDRECLSCQ